MTKQLPNSTSQSKAVASKTSSKPPKLKENQEVQLIPISFVSDTNNLRLLSLPNINILTGLALTDLYDEDNGVHEEVCHFFAAYCCILSLNPSSIMDPETWKCVFLSSLVAGALTNQFSFPKDESERLQKLLVQLC